MYNDGIITNEFTGYYDPDYYGVGDGAYVYPTARQDLVVQFSSFYLSANEGDFTADGVTFSSETGESEDITIGNAPAKVFSATMLNPHGLMESLTWGDGEVSIGVATTTSTYTVPDETLFYCVNGGCTVRVTMTTAYKTYGGVTKSVSLSSTPGGVLLTGTTANVYTDDGKLYYCNYNAASWSVTTVPLNNFLATKYVNMNCAIVKAGNSIPTERWTVSGTTATQSVFTYVPMGTYDFSNVDAFGITFNVEAYDKMVLFDADATDWVGNLTFPTTISALISDLMTEMVMTASISANAVNTSLSLSMNPITSYSVSYRQVLKWLAEVIGCNVRIGRTGNVEFVTFDSASPVATITPNTIISNTRTKTRYAVPQITQAVCYNTLGAAYTSGTTSGTNYYIVANPFLDPSADLTPLTNLKTLLNGIPTYYPTAISIACYDPRIDAGDFVSLQMPNGSSPYAIPIMRQTIKWCETATAELIANGNQVRQIPDSMDSTDLSSVVDSNPSAVVNKIQAVGISADWITTGKLTVLDNSTPPNVLFKADKDTHQVQIGGFNVEDDRLIAQTTETVGGVNYTNQVKVKTDEIELSKLWNVTSSQLLNLSRSELYLYFNNSAISNRQTAHIGNGYLTLKDASTYLDVNAASVKLHTTDGTPITDPNDPDTTYENPIMELKAGMSGYKTTASADAIKTTDGTNTITASPTGLSFDDGTNPASMRMYTMVCASSSETTQTKTLPAGAYVIYHWRNRAPTQGSTGIQFAVIGESSYQSIIEIGGSGTHVTHDSTMTGTRSYCNVVSAGNGTGTLTWTASGLTNRRLTLTRLW